jgi:hypothetical protein
MEKGWTLSDRIDLELESGLSNCCYTSILMLSSSYFPLLLKKPCSYSICFYEEARAYTSFFNDSLFCLVGGVTKG